MLSDTKDVLKILALSLITVIGFLGIFEILLRVNGYQGNQFRAILFGDDPNSSQLFQNSPRLWWELKKNHRVSFMGVMISTNDMGFRASPSKSQEK